MPPAPRPRASSVSSLVQTVWLSILTWASPAPGAGGGGGEGQTGRDPAPGAGRGGGPFQAGPLQEDLRAASVHLCGRNRLLSLRGGGVGIQSQQGFQLSRRQHPLCKKLAQPIAICVALGSELASLSLSSLVCEMGRELPGVGDRGRANWGQCF